MDSVSILGLGASGVAAARLALSTGGDVYVSDLRSDAKAAAGGATLQELGADVELGRHDLERIARSDTVVVSPGIPPDAPLLRALRDRGKRWISEPEYAFRFLRRPLIAVTGTNGKTTTVALIAHLLREGGVEVGLGGNIGAGLGPPACDLVMEHPQPDWHVWEMSSFQLADIETFRPDIGVLTNLAPDHLDRYGSVEAYYADKARLFENADPDSRWVLNADDDGVLALARDAAGERWYFSAQAGSRRGGRLEDGLLVLDMGDGQVEPLLRRSALPLLGTHNLANALAAAVVARLAGVPAGALGAGLRTVRPLAHRLQAVVERDGVLWVNDSKATNVAAAASAVRSLTRPLVILLGGKDKGEDLGPLADALEARARVAVTYGAAGPRIADALEGRVPVVRAGSDMEEVVRVARDHARKGDLILLSPACSSFDMFEDYEERGERFAALAYAVDGGAHAVDGAVSSGGS
ncbi:MAG: UDP-N-acetylmuramoyl-L-alanine--D-glutamate ligase [Gemmatimonadetes bacterium]|nr:UDP-N-acetylmuramoyl-L-alanine--D-glutamate ligase [Gemmatimonadota bacterium]